MFKISSNSILTESTPMAYKRGKEYYTEKRVKSISYIQDRLLFDADVLGSEKYNVQVQFDRSGDVSYAECSCPAHEDYWGFCKHIVAVLLVIRDKAEEGLFDNLKSKQISKQIFSYFQNMPSALKTPINMEITYRLKKGSYYGQKIVSSLSFRIGLDRMYILKDIKSLLWRIESGERMEFGKNFTFDPRLHRFKESDSKVIDLLMEIYDTEKVIENNSYGYSRGASLFKDKEVLLPDSAVKRFLNIMERESFKGEIFGESYDNMKINTEDFPVRFNVTKEDEGIMLDMEYANPLLPITQEGEYFLSGDTIYKTSKEKRESFKPFYMAMLQQQESRIYFYNEDKERFVSEVLPFAERAGEVLIDEALQSSIRKLDLETEIYLDKAGKSISADVKFIYGESTINPFGVQTKLSQSDGMILVRDIEKEKLVLDTLGESDFKVRNDKIYLDDEEDIYNFVFETIPKVQEHAQIFYSENFNGTIMRQPASFSGRVRLNQETDMLEISFNIDGIERSELINVFNSLKEKKKYYRLKNGAFLQLDTKELIEMADIVEYLDLDKKDFEKEQINIPKYRAIYLNQHIKDSELKYFERNSAFKEFVRNITDPEETEFNIPETLTGTLREYQKFGFKWLKSMSHYGLGAILADDMGLGKTLQVITLLLSDKHEKGTFPSLIVVPTSLVYNWQVEIEKFAPELNTAVVAGAKDQRMAILNSANEYDVIITSYPLIRRDIDDYEQTEFRYCILDEAQHIKNPHSQNAKSVKSIKCHRRFALTGTPMENSLEELWSIFDFVLPGYLFSHRKFTEKYAKPIVKEEDKKALGELAKHIKPFILRRLKTEVLKELPQKIEHKLTAELTESQKKVYMAYLQQVRNDIDRNIKEEGFNKSHIKILAALTRLRQICCHPSVFLEGFEGESGKMLLLQEVIEESIGGGHRILLFSQFTSMLGIIKKWLNNRDIEFLYLDGETKIEERGRMVKAFNNGKGSIFLISLKAGGTGLNLTGADTVIHYDPWWNPAVEDQATDRAYRIGQNKSVHVMKLITRGTIEEKIYNLQESKRKLIDSIIEPGETMLSKMSEEEVRALFE